MAHQKTPFPSLLMPARGYPDYLGASHGMGLSVSGQEPGFRQLLPCPPQFVPPLVLQTISHRHSAFSAFIHAAQVVPWGQVHHHHLTSNGIRQSSVPVEGSRPGSSSLSPSASTSPVVMRSVPSQHPHSIDAPSSHFLCHFNRLREKVGFSGTAGLTSSGMMAMGSSPLSSFRLGATRPFLWYTALSFHLLTPEAVCCIRCQMSTPSQIFLGITVALFNLAHSCLR